MKKVLFWLMAILPALAFTACGGDDDNDSSGGSGGNTELAFTGMASDITSSAATITCNFSSSASISTLQLGVMYSDNQQTIENKKGLTALSNNVAGNTYQLTISNLSPKTVYYYRAYMVSGGTAYYGAISNFMTLDNKYDYNGHTAVDMGLPSGTKWATTNLEANSPEACGGYFAWGEKYSKSYFTKQTYEYDNWNLGMDISGSIYDPAVRKWGEPWCMPTKEDMEELVQNCTFEWTTNNDMNGALVTGPNGNTIFLPAVGYCVYANTYNLGEVGQYWSSNVVNAAGSTQIYTLFVNSDEMKVDESIRYQGRCIRPVCR